MPSQQQPQLQPRVCKAAGPYPLLSLCEAPLCVHLSRAQHLLRPLQPVPLDMHKGLCIRREGHGEGRDCGGGERAELKRPNCWGERLGW